MDIRVAEAELLHPPRVDFFVLLVEALTVAALAGILLFLG